MNAITDIKPNQIKLYRIEVESDEVDENVVPVADAIADLTELLKPL
jgi:hypothetical protein